MLNKYIYGCLFLLICIIKTQAQSQDDCADLIGNPMPVSSYVGEADCLGEGMLITSQAQFESLGNSDLQLFGVSLDSLDYNDKLSDETINDQQVLLSTSFGNASIEELLDCFDILCAPGLDEMQNVIDAVDLLDLVTEEQIIGMANELDLTDEELAYLEDNPDLVASTTNALITNLGSATLVEILQNAFNIDPEDCENSDWAGYEDINPLTGGPVSKSKEDGDQRAFGAEDAGDFSLENMFKKEIAGFGESAANPSESAGASIQSSNDLYNGKGSFSTVLDNVGIKDLNLPISVSSEAGGMRINDQESILGTNMQLNAGGQVTRIVNGLPDEFRGIIEGYAYGTQTALAPTLAFGGFNLNLGLQSDMADALATIACKIIRKLIDQLLTNSEFGSCLDVSEIIGILEQIEALQVPASHLNQVSQALNGEFELSPGNQTSWELPNADADLVFKIKTTFFLNDALGVKIGLVLEIPLGNSPFQLEFTTSFRAAFEILNIPAIVRTETQSIGYYNIDNETLLSADNDPILPTTYNTWQNLGDFNLNTFDHALMDDLSDFFELSSEDQRHLLMYARGDTKIADRKYFTPLIAHFADVLSVIAQMDLTDLPPLKELLPDDEISITTEKNQNIDLQPDQFTFNFNGYSGSFYLKKDEDGNLIVTGLEPYSDLVINVIQLVDTDNQEFLGLEGFVFTTPDGKRYEFNVKETTEVTSFQLPFMFDYKAKGSNEDEEFLTPTLAQIEQESFQRLKRKLRITSLGYADYYTNFNISKNPVHTSAWHLSKVKSLQSGEYIDISYINKDITYNLSKNWTYTFPDFEWDESKECFKTLNSPIAHEDVYEKDRKWYHGTSALTYSVSEANVSKPYITNISTTDEESSLEFIYDGVENRALPGSHLLKRLNKYHKSTFHHGWDFSLDTKSYQDVSTSCNNSIPQQGDAPPAFQCDVELFELDIEKGVDHAVRQSMYKFNNSVSILSCINFNFPIRSLRNVDKINVDENSDYFYRTTINEYTSLREIKQYIDNIILFSGNLLTLPSVQDFKEEERLEAEYVRNYLTSVKEVDKNYGESIYLSFEYYDEEKIKNLPKRFSFEQDILGYYNANSRTNPLFIAQQYKDVIGGFTWNTHHFSFASNLDSPSTMSHRIWQGSIDLAKIGQLLRVENKHKGFVEYDYDQHSFPVVPGSIFSESVIKTAGLRLKSLKKGSSDGSTSYTTYTYNNPTLVNAPVFMHRNLANRYLGVEAKVTVGWTPLNIWYDNKSAKVGYEIVEEVYEDNGKQVVEFAVPVRGSNVLLPETELLSFFQNGPKKYIDDEVEFEKLNDEVVLDEISEIFPLIVKQEEFGYIERRSVYGAAGEDGNASLKQETSLDYSFESLEGNVDYGTLEQNGPDRNKIITSSGLNVSFKMPHIVSYKMHMYHNASNYVDLLQFPNGNFKELDLVHDNNAYHRDPIMCKAPLLIDFWLWLTQSADRRSSYNKSIVSNFFVSEYDHITRRRLLTSESVRTFNDDGSFSDVVTSYVYNDDNPVDVFFDKKLITKTVDYKNGTNTVASTVENYYYADLHKDELLEFVPHLDQGLLDIISAEPSPSSSSNRHIEAPIYVESYLDGNLVGGSISDLSLDGGRILPNRAYKFVSGKFMIDTEITDYDDRGNLASAKKYLANNLAALDPNPSAAFIDPAKYSNTPFVSITMEWDGTFDLPTIKTINGWTQTYNYNTENGFELKSIIDHNGNWTIYSTDNLWRPKTEEIRLGANTELSTKTYNYQNYPFQTETISTYKVHEYDEVSNSQQEEMISIGQRMKYDGWGNLLKETRLGNGQDDVINSYVYDNMFRPVTVENISTGTTTNVYDASLLGRLTEQTDAVGNSITYEYKGGATGKELTSVWTTDPNGHTTEVYTDAFGNTLRTISGEKNVTNYTYDQYLRPVSIINPIGEVYSYDYHNVFGMLNTKTIPHKGSENYYYNLAGQLVATEDAKGNKVVSYYDSNFNLKKSGIYTGAFSTSNFNTTLYPMDAFESSTSGYEFPEELLLLENTYDYDDDDGGNTSFLKSTREGILEGTAKVGFKKMDYTFDARGRIEEILTEYDGITFGSTNTILSPLNGDGSSSVQQQIITGPAANQSYTFDSKQIFDHVRRPIQQFSFFESDLKAKTVSHYNTSDLMDYVQLGVNGDGEYLQEVNYSYDAAGKLIRINEEEDLSCLQTVNVCQLSWHSSDDENFDFESCANFTSIGIDGDIYYYPDNADPSPIPFAENVAQIMEWVNQKIAESNKLGTVYIDYEELMAGTYKRAHISAMKTDIDEFTFDFDGCTFNLMKECCFDVYAVVTEDSESGERIVQLKEDLFFEEITYDGLDINKIDYFGSCISGLVTNHYKYDADHRLTDVFNKIYNPHINQDAFSTSYSYDNAGNIQTLKRRGYMPNAAGYKYGVIDDLVYEYEQIGIDVFTSKLLRIRDLAFDTNPIGAGQGFKSPNTKYGYDANGNMISDSGKGLSGNTTYNILNLPGYVEMVGEEGTISFTYTYSGEKIKKSVEDKNTKNGDQSGTRKYINGFEYKNDVLQFINVPHGRILVSGSGENLSTDTEYFINDHLGNTVVVFGDKDNDGFVQETDDETSNEVTQRNLYYSFGMRVDDPSYLYGSTKENDYLYNGKELEGDLGLDLHFYGARWYDASIGRWNGVDPLASKYPSISPYAAMNNNPLYWVDPDGRENIPAVLWAIKNMANRGIPFGIWYGGQSGWSFQRGTVPTETVCYESCWTSYMNGADSQTESYFKNSGFAARSGGFKGRNAGIDWFKSGGDDRSFVSDITQGEIGDIVFMGNSGNMEGHATLLLDIPEITKDKDGNINRVRLITLSTGSDSDNSGGYGVRDFSFSLQDGVWKADDGNPGHDFRGFGQMNNIEATDAQEMDLHIQKVFLDYGNVKSLSTHDGVIEQN